MKTVYCTKDSELRGRNGWSKLRTLEVWNPGGATEIWVDAFSSRVGKQPPVILKMSLDEAAALAKALLEVVRGRL